MTCRKHKDGIETGGRLLPRDESGRNLFTAQVVSGVEAARAWFRLWYGTWEPVASIPRFGGMAPRLQKGDPQAAETVRGRVPMRGTGADRLVVAMMPGNAGGAKGTGHPGLFDGQPQLCGRSR
jgi:hypothetical protein